MTLTQILQKIRSAFYTKAETDTKLNTKANDSDVVHKSGDEIVNGTKTFTSEIVNTSPHFRHIYGDYGTFWRQDGTNLYLLLTNSGDQYGSWNNFRPLTVNLATGVCDISGTATNATNAAYADNCRYSRLLGTYADDGHCLCPDRYDGWNTRLYMTIPDKSVKADSVHVHHADYAARSAGDGAFFISGYQIYVG